MKKDQLKLMGEIFITSALDQLEMEDTFAIGVAAGIYQGLKYKGSVITGVKTAAAVIGAISASNGIKNVIRNIDKIRDI